MKCPKCDLNNPAKSHFCSKCGTKLSLKKPPKKAPRKKTSKKKTYHSKTKTIRAKTAAEELTTGSTFAGRYQVIEELGKGGFGKDIPHCL